MRRGELLSKGVRKLCINVRKGKQTSGSKPEKCKSGVEFLFTIKPLYASNRLKYQKLATTISNNDVINIIVEEAIIN